MQCNRYFVLLSLPTRFDLNPMLVDAASRPTHRSLDWYIRIARTRLGYEEPRGCQVPLAIELNNGREFLFVAGARLGESTII